MKKLLAAILSLSLAAASLAGCGASGVPAADSSSKSSSDKAYKIGVVQLVEHAALDSAYQGFVDG